MDLSLTNVINVQVSNPQAGIGEYNTSNIGLFTRDIPAGSFGTDGFKIYVEPSDVATDFGTDSYTYKMALAIFSQQPNILNNNGYLAIILLEAGTVEIQNVDPSGVPASGQFKLVYGSFTTDFINWDDTAAEIQAALRLYEPLRLVEVTGSLATSLNVTFVGVNGDATTLSTTSNTLQTSAPAAITFTISTPTPGVAGETLAAAITRTIGLIQYSAIMGSEIPSEADMLAAAAVVETLNKMALFVSYDSADIEPAGMLDLLTTGNFHKNRGLYYGADSDVPLLDALVFMASYGGRGFSTNFDGSNTTSTMHLKDLIGVQPDPTMTQTLLNKALAAGADTYPSLQGVPKVFCSGANHFFDQVYNLMWFVGALEVAGFNYLAQAATKIPQTEDGMRGLKGAYRLVCQQGIVNLYGAPGSWTSATTFGDQSDFLANIRQVGFYIFSQPISQQSPTDRADRKAPLIQIAFKEAGAIHSSNVIVNINA